MKFKNKLLIFISISILIPVLVIISANFIITGKHVAQLQFELLSNTVDYVLSKSESDFQAINALGMAEVDFYREATQKQILQSIKNRHAPGESVWIIDTRSADVVYASDDSQGLILNPKQIEQMVQQQKGHAEFELTSRSGQVIETMLALGVFPQWHWLVVSSVNKNQLHRYIYDAMMFTVVAATIFLIFIFVLVNKFSKGIGSALVALQQGAIRLSKNDFGAEISIQGNDEFSSLASSFNMMSAEIRKTQNHLHATLNAMPDLLFEVDVRGCIFGYHSNRNHLLALPPEQFIGKTFAEVLPKKAAEVCLKALQEAALSGYSSGRVYSLALPQGEAWFELSVAAMAENGDEQRHYVMLARDITKRKHALETQQKLADRLSLAIRAASVGIWEYDFVSDKLSWDKACYTLFGIQPEQYSDAMEAHLKGIHPEDLNRVQENFQHTSEGEIEHDTEFRVVWPTGEIRHIRSIGMFHRDAKGKPLRMIGTNWDITEQKQHQKELERIAHFDCLTGLPNRMLLHDRLQHAMSQSKRSAKLLAVAYLDLDGFKSINDRYGHAYGDRLLIVLSERMKLALREGDTLARIGGDEFVVVLTDLDDVTDSMPMLGRLLSAASEPVREDGCLFEVSASIGVAFFHQKDELDGEQLIRQADQAMYQAKVTGKNRYHVFDAAEDSSVRSHHESLEKIRLAFERNEFVMFYQPKINMSTGMVVGAEALIRWQHPEKGLLAPEAFLPVIEDDPLSVRLGEWVIDTVMAQMEIWQALDMFLPVSINVGARQLQQADFMERLSTILDGHSSVSPSQLQFEILETSALEDMAQVSKVIDSCALRGVTFALDDFGTGYSSLTYLKSLHVSALKMDQSFVHDMLIDSDDLSILKAVISLAKAFNRQVIAEGVETHEQGAELMQLGCNFAQGFGIAYPMAAEKMPGWLSNWRPSSFA